MSETDAKASDKAHETRDGPTGPSARRGESRGEGGDARGRACNRAAPRSEMMIASILRA